MTQEVRVGAYKKYLAVKNNGVRTLILIDHEAALFYRVVGSPAPAVILNSCPKPSMLSDKLGKKVHYFQNSRSVYIVEQFFKIFEVDKGYGVRTF